jgi:TonB family protein
MKAHLTAAILLGVVAGGCGTDEQARKKDPYGVGGPEYKIKQRKAKEALAAEAAAKAAPPPKMKVQNEIGVVEAEDVETTIEEHFTDIKSCYTRAGKAQKFAGGKVLLRFFLAGDGHPDDVLVVESTLGNYNVERCLVEVGRRIPFRPPLGRKATTFDYPVEFRPSQNTIVVEHDGPKLDKDVAAQIHQLAACGPLGKKDATAILYIQARGVVGSVGLASSAALDEDTGDCMVQTIRKWRMSASLPGRVLRANFTIPPFISAAEPSRRAALSVAVRKRRR